MAANATPKNLDDILHDYAPTPDEGVGLAVQCQARGWTALAKALLRLSLKEDPEGTAPKTRLARFAWRYWDHQLVEPDTDWARIDRRLRAVRAAEKSLDTEDNRLLLRALEKSLVPCTAKPGSLAASVDGLMGVHSTELQFLENPDPLYLRVVNLGFDAIPELIDHLDDNRLTRCLADEGFVLGGGRDVVAYHRCVGDLAGELLQRLSGENLGAHQLWCLHGEMMRKAEARAWWAKARKVGEEAYLLAHTLPGGTEKEFPNPLLLRLAVSRYPQHLPRLYHTLLKDHPNVESWPLVEAIAASSLPRPRQSELFREAARHTNLKHREAALWQLKNLEPREFVKDLTQTLNAIPRGPTDQGTQAKFGRLAAETDDPEVWRALERAARRAGVGLRLELLENAAAPSLGTRQRKQRLAFLAAFLEDTTVRDRHADPTKYEDLYAALYFPRVEVRDFAALEIAMVLELPVEPQPEWKPEQWAKLRKQVREALRR